MASTADSEWELAPRSSGSESGGDCDDATRGETSGVDDIDEESRPARNLCADRDDDDVHAVAASPAASAADPDASVPHSSRSSANSPEVAQEVGHDVQTIAERVMSSICSFFTAMKATALDKTDAANLIKRSVASAVTYAADVNARLSRLTGLTQHMLSQARDAHNDKSSPAHGQPLLPRQQRSDALNSRSPGVQAITTHLLASSYCRWSPDSKDVWIDKEDGTPYEKLLYAVTDTKLHQDYVETVNRRADDPFCVDIPLGTTPLSFNSWKKHFPQWCVQDTLRTCVCKRCDNVDELLSRLQRVITRAHAECAKDSACECKQLGTLRQKLIAGERHDVHSWMRMSTCPQSAHNPNGAFSSTWPPCREFQPSVQAARKRQTYNMLEDNVREQFKCNDCGFHRLFKTDNATTLAVEQQKRALFTMYQYVTTSENVQHKSWVVVDGQFVLTAVPHHSKKKKHAVVYIRDRTVAQYLQVINVAMSDRLEHDHELHCINKAVKQHFHDAPPTEGHVQLMMDFAMDISCTGLARMGKSQLQLDFFNPIRVGLMGIVARYVTVDDEQELKWTKAWVPVLGGAGEHGADTVAAAVKQVLLKVNDLASTPTTHVKCLTDGGPGHFKNRKNFRNMCRIATHFNVVMDWFFKPSSHGKDAYDALMAALKFWLQAKAHEGVDVSTVKAVYSLVLSPDKYAKYFTDLRKGAASSDISVVLPIKVEAEQLPEWQHGVDKSDGYVRSQHHFRFPPHHQIEGEQGGRATLKYRRRRLPCPDAGCLCWQSVDGVCAKAKVVGELTESTVATLQLTPVQQVLHSVLSVSTSSPNKADISSADKWMQLFCKYDKTVSEAFMSAQHIKSASLSGVDDVPLPPHLSDCRPHLLPVLFCILTRQKLDVIGKQLTQLTIDVAAAVEAAAAERAAAEAAAVAAAAAEQEQRRVAAAAAAAAAEQEQRRVAAAAAAEEAAAAVAEEERQKAQQQQQQKQKQQEQQLRKRRREESAAEQQKEALRLQQLDEQKFKARRQVYVRARNSTLMCATDSHTFTCVVKAGKRAKTYTCHCELCNLTVHKACIEQNERLNGRVDSFDYWTCLLCLDPTHRHDATADAAGDDG